MPRTIANAFQQYCYDETYMIFFLSEVDPFQPTALARTFRSQVPREDVVSGMKAWIENGPKEERDAILKSFEGSVYSGRTPKRR